MDEVVKAKAADPNLKRMSEAAQGAYAGSSYPAQPNPFFDVIQSEAVLEDMLAQIIVNSVKPAAAVAQAAERIQGIADEMQALQK